MSKKYQIINSNTDSNCLDECTIFYILYIVLFFVIIFIIYKIIFGFYQKKEKFENVSQIPSISSTITSQEILHDLTEKNKELNTIKDTLENKLIEQSQAIYISNNFNKVDSSSFNDELSYLLVNFSGTKFPEFNMDNKKIINNQKELDIIMTESKNMKNIYIPGDIVTSNSTFNISKDDICYRYNNKPIKPTLEFMTKYPNCMVCAVEDNNNIKDTLGWKHTKTNISKVCLYDPKATDKTGTPNLAQCKSYCNIKS